MSIYIKDPIRCSITGSAGSVAWDNVTGKPASFNPSDHNHSQITGNLTITGQQLIFTHATPYIKFNSSTTVLAYDGTDLRIGTSSYPTKIKGSSTTIDNNVTVSGSVSASSGFFDTSDERLKNIVKPLDTDIDKLSEIRKIYFNYKDNDTEQKIGVIAQDVQKIYPEIVEENTDGMLTVDYSKLSVLALDAVDQLNQKNKELEDRLNKIENLLKDKGIL